MQTEDTLRPGAAGAVGMPWRTKARVPTVGVAPLELLHTDGLDAASLAIDCACARGQSSHRHAFGAAGAFTCRTTLKRRQASARPRLGTNRLGVPAAGEALLGHGRHHERAAPSPWCRRPACWRGFAPGRISDAVMRQRRVGVVHRLLVAHLRGCPGRSKDCPRVRTQSGLGTPICVRVCGRNRG
jgi:hypothetical protein